MQGPEVHDSDCPTCLCTTRLARCCIITPPSSYRQGQPRYLSVVQMLFCQSPYQRVRHPARKLWGPCTLQSRVLPKSQLAVLCRRCWGPGRVPAGPPKGSPRRQLLAGAEVVAGPRMWAARAPQRSEVRKGERGCRTAPFSTPAAAAWASFGGSETRSWSKGRVRRKEKRRRDRKSVV